MIKFCLILSVAAMLAVTSAQGAAAPKEFQALQGIVAPKIQFWSSGGKQLSIDNFKGKVVILNLWATWCAPCIKEMPSLDRLSARLDNEKAVVVAVSQDKGGVAIAKQFIDRIGVENLVVYADPSGKLSRDLGVRGLPTTFIVTPDGTITSRVEGPTDWDTLQITNYISTLGR